MEQDCKCRFLDRDTDLRNAVSAWELVEDVLLVGTGAVRFDAKLLPEHVHGIYQVRQDCNATQKVSSCHFSHTGDVYTSGGKKRRTGKAEVRGTWFCFAEFSMCLHIESVELCYLGTLPSMPRAPQQPFVPDSQGAHYAQGHVFVRFFTQKRGKFMRNQTVVRR